MKTSPKIPNNSASLKFKITCLLCQRGDRALPVPQFDAGASTTSRAAPQLSAPLMRCLTFRSQTRVECENAWDGNVTTLSPGTTLLVVAVRGGSSELLACRSHPHR